MSEQEILRINVRLQNLVEAINDAVQEPLVIEYLQDAKHLRTIDFNTKWSEARIPYKTVFDALESLDEIT